MWIGGRSPTLVIELADAPRMDHPPDYGKRPVKCVLRGGVGWCRVSFSQQGVWHGTAGTAD